MRREGRGGEGGRGGGGKARRYWIDYCTVSYGEPTYSNASSSRFDSLVEQSDIFVTDSSSDKAMKRVRALSVAGRKHVREGSMVGTKEGAQGGANNKNGWRMWCIRGTRNMVKKTIAQLGIKKAAGGRMLLPISMADFVRYLASENHTSRRRHVPVGGDPTERFLEYFGVDLDAVKAEDAVVGNDDGKDQHAADFVEGEGGAVLGEARKGKGDVRSDTDRGDEDDKSIDDQPELLKPRSMVDEIVAEFHDPYVAAQRREELLRAFEDEDSFFSGLTDFAIFADVFKSHYENASTEEIRALWMYGARHAGTYEDGELLPYVTFLEVLGRVRELEKQTLGPQWYRPKYEVL